ncbi:MAG: T9SS type A sorting domain-containing protein [bacterium]
MKKCLCFLCFTVMIFAEYALTDKPKDIQRISSPKGMVFADRVFIDSIGNISTVLGQCKNITVCQHGDNVAVIYGVTEMPGMIVQIAYSTDSGANWSYYGPFGYAETVEVSIDGSPDFCTNPGQIYFIMSLHGGYGYYDELCMMVEENVPSAPSFSILAILPNSQSPAMWPWEPCIAIAQDNPSYLVVTAWSLLLSGNEWAYCWISDDGGYTWTDSIPMAFITQDGASGHVRQGTDGYVFYTYQDYYTYVPADSTPYPYYMESTDGGYTWSPEAPIPGVPVNSGSMFWWHEFDCEVVNNEPWAIHTDIGAPGGGPYLMHGIGNPGNWTWEKFDVKQLGTCSLTIADTTFYCYPNQYPNLSYDPVSNTVLASYKAYYYKKYAGTIYYNGAHIGGIYTTDNGANWTITEPLSAPNIGQIAFDDWNSTDVAHRLANVDGNIYSYALWAHEVDLILYFERGLVKSFLPTGIEENDDVKTTKLSLTLSPTIVSNACQLRLTTPVKCEASITILDCAGRKVRELYRGNIETGSHIIEIPTSRLPKGIYFARLETASSTQVLKFVVAD